MPIQELPQATSCLLNSSQVFITPASLVKELIDNAFDAKATSIDVIIAANTVDRIEVRDNGHGIAPGDINALGKRGHTSKLRNFEELRTLGGQSLGFRGEALASAVELGDVSITTRTEGEGVATCIELNPCGGIKSQTSASHPVGTTVCVSNFFSRLPVRKQNALRDIKKTMTRIKEILQSYALARLNTRLTLKVLKLSSGNWSFAPLRSKDGIKDAVSQVIGRDTAAQCMERISQLPIPTNVAECSSLGSGSSTFLNGESLRIRARTGFVIHAFLPKLDADLSKVSGGQFLSIDSRPVSAARGTMKKIVSIYKALLSSLSVDHKLEKVKHPFIRLNIVCPAGSYDPNIEPAKDNVLFEDEFLLLSLVEDWFSNIYGDRLSSITVLKRRSTASVIDQSTNGAEMMTLIAERDAIPGVDVGVTIGADINVTGVDARASACTKIWPQSRDPSSLDGRDANSVPTSELNLQGDGGMALLSTRCEVFNSSRVVNQGASVLDMSQGFQDEFDIDGDEEITPCNEVMVEHLEEKHISRNCNSLDPWIIAKLNTPVIKKRNAGDPHMRDPTREITSQQLPSTPPPFMLHKLGASITSRQSPKSCQPLRFERPSRDDASAPDNLQNPFEQWLNQNGAVPRDNSLPVRFRSFPSSENLDGTENSRDAGSRISARDILHGIPRSLPTSQGHLVLSRPPNFNRPFVPPLKDSQLLSSPNSSPATEQRDKSIPSHRPRYNGSTSNLAINVDARDDLSRNKSQLEVYEALEFERRKEAATRRLHKELRQSQLVTGGPSNSTQAITGSLLHKSRNHASVAALELNQTCSSVNTREERASFESCLSEDDPRAYLMRRRQSLTRYPDTGHKLKRAKTMLLPLEKIPSSAELNHLSQVIPADVIHIRKTLLVLMGYDEYIKSGHQAMGLDICTEDIAVIKNRLEKVLQSWMQANEMEQLNIVLDLGSLKGRSIVGAIERGNV